MDGDGWRKKSMDLLDGSAYWAPEFLRVLEGEKLFFYESTFDRLEFETWKKNKKFNPIAWIFPVSSVHITEHCTLETYFTAKYVEITNITLFKRQMRPCISRTAFYCKCYCSVQRTQGSIFLELKLISYCCKAAMFSVDMGHMSKMTEVSR